MATQKEDQKLVFKTDYHLMQVKILQNAPREHSAILLTFIKLPFVFKTFVFCLFLSGCLRQVLLYNQSLKTSSESQLFGSEVVPGQLGFDSRPGCGNTFSYTALLRLSYRKNLIEFQ